MEYSIATYFLYFLIIAICGWMMEVTLQLIQKHKFADRGFLVGPYCPIYGCGAILITLCLTGLKEHPVGLFSTAILVCGVLEYATSYIMEKLFHARWWDYSDCKFNINGRVCIETIIPFGILGVLLIYVVNPFIFDNLAKVPENILNIVAIAMAVLFVADLIVSLRVVVNFRSTTTKFDKENPQDNTEEISQKVKEFLKGKSILNRRLINAFPKWTAILKEQGEKIKKKTNEVKEEISSKAYEMKEDISDYANGVKEEITQRADEVKRTVKKGIVVTSRKVKNGVKRSNRKQKKY